MRQILGGHVHQKGSLVAPDRLRFDFTHSQPVTPDEIRQIEELVNAEILNDADVNIYTDVPIDEARSRGAMALFGEKYGDRVRMVEIPDFSLELCGGTHLTPYVAGRPVQDRVGNGRQFRRAAHRGRDRAGRLRMREPAGGETRAGRRPAQIQPERRGDGRRTPDTAAAGAGKAEPATESGQRRPSPPN